MNILALPFIHYAAHRFGWPSLRAKAFDAKYNSGHWTDMDECHEVIRAVERINAGGRIIVLGCGTNALGRGLSPYSYSILNGLDMSSEAIARSTKSAPPAQRFYLADMENFADGTEYDTVVFHESINYISPSKVVAVLGHWIKQLRLNGRIIITIAQAERYKPLLDLVRNNFPVIEDNPVKPGKERRIMVIA